MPDYDYPIANVKKHKLLPDGKYYNLWDGFDEEPEEPGERDIDFEGKTKLLME